MKSEKSHSQKSKREFGGCVEFIPPQSNYIEFIDARRLWAFAIGHLTHFVLQENPHRAGGKTSPPDQLVLVYYEAYVVLRGWRLELLVDPLMNARIARVHAEKHLGTLMIEVAWVEEIHVLLRDSTILKTEHMEEWIKNQP